jgi:hypothetical protein
MLIISRRRHLSLARLYSAKDSGAVRSDPVFTVRERFEVIALHIYHETHALADRSATPESICFHVLDGRVGELLWNGAF